MADETSGNALDVTLRDFSAGQRVFQRYTLIRTLGRGGMGVVWLAHDEVLDRDVALKFLPEIIIHDRAVLEDLKRETKRSLELTHKNIIRIHDFVHDVISGCISMEYVEGDTLSNLRADKPAKIFEPEEIKPWLTQLCDALDYAHNHARIIHRDLKPSNLMVSKRGQLKVSDFGIARSINDSVSRLTMERGTSGTLVYMSPQQLDGERGTHLDDIYSLGATIYELLTSKPPFYSGDIGRQIHEKIPPSMAQRRLNLEIEGQTIPKEWEQTVAACLAKDPAKRPRSVAEIAQRLELTLPQTLAPRVHAAPSKRKVLLVVSAAAAAICIVAVVAWSLRYRATGEKAPARTVLQLASPAPTELGVVAVPLPTGTAVPAVAQSATKTFSANAAGAPGIPAGPPVLIPAKGVDVNLPIGITGEMSTSDYVSVSVDTDGNPYFDKEEMTYEKLTATLTVAHDENPEAKVFVRGDANTVHFNIIRVLDVLRAVGFYKVAFEIKSRGANASPATKGVLGILVDLPKAFYSLPNPKDYVSIQVRPGNQVYFDDHLVSDDQVLQRLAHLHQANLDTKVSISAEGMAKHGDVISVLDRVRSAGITFIHYDIRAVPPQEVAKDQVKGTAADSSGFISISQAKPFAIFAPKPEYPPEARNLYITGVGVCAMTVDRASGNVTDAIMMQSTASPILDNAIMSTFKRWKFKPGTVSKVKAPIVYTTHGASY